jgi:capsular exopolysaccharide synthesis family protein
MELRDYLRIIRKRLILIIVATISCAGAALGTSLVSTPIYEGTTKLLVVAKTERDGGITSAYQGALLSQQLIESFAQILESRGTAEQALRLDPLPITARELQEKVTAEPVTETLLINLRVEDPDPARAKRLANSVTRAFIESVPRLQGGSTLRVSLVEPALQPTQPVRPKTKLNTAFGLALGLMLGVGLAFLREFLDRSLKTAEQLEAAAGVPVVGMIPPFKAARQPIPVAQQPRTPAAEAFRKLRTNFGFLGVDREDVCCVVTSPASADGKSTVTANLAIALAQTGQRVAVIDADLRKPSLHKLFDLPQRVGTTTVLLDQADVEDALQYPGPDLPAVLTAGQLPPNPSELLGSRRMADLVARLRASYNVVLIDCAPLLPVTDPMVVSQFADGVLLVTRSGKTTRDQATAVRAVCAKAGARVFGTVLNATPVTEGDQPSHYAYYGEVGRAGRRKVEPGRDRLAVNGNGNGSHVAENGRGARHRRIRFGSRR